VAYMTAGPCNPVHKSETPASSWPTNHARIATDRVCFEPFWPAAVQLRWMKPWRRGRRGEARGGRLSGSACPRRRGAQKDPMGERFLRTPCNGEGLPPLVGGGSLYGILFSPVPRLRRPPTSTTFLLHSTLCHVSTWKYAFDQTRK
jgi:hypothetical protein